jgi:hypothetical protein
MTLTCVVVCYSSTRGSRGNPREHMALHHRSTPPPAVSTESTLTLTLNVTSDNSRIECCVANICVVLQYNCNEFYRTYSDMNQLTDDQRSDVGGRNTLS